MSTAINLTIDQASVFTLVLFRARDFRNQVIDLEGITGNADFKIDYNSSSVAFTLPIVANANGEVIISGNTESTNVPPGRYVYDVLLDNGIRIVSGLATVNPAVTF